MFELTLSVRTRRIPHRPHTIIVHLRAKVNPQRKLLLRLIRLVNVLLHLALHKSPCMVDRRIDHAVLDGFSDNVLGVFFRFEVQLVADVSEGDTRVGEGNGAKSGLDDEMPQAEDEEMGRVGDKGGFVGVECFLECGDVADADSYLSDAAVDGASTRRSARKEC
jgi:hypothetical protein